MRFLSKVLGSCLQPRRSCPQSSKNTPSQEQDGGRQSKTTKPVADALQPFHVNLETPKPFYHVCYKCAHAPGFSTEALYDQHVRNMHQKHSVVATRVWMCKDTGCPDADVVWTRFEGYRQHLRTAHNVTDTLRLWDDQMAAPTDIPTSVRDYNLRYRGAEPIEPIEPTDFQLPSYQPASSRQDCCESVRPPPYDLRNDVNPPAYIL